MMDIDMDMVMEILYYSLILITIILAWRLVKIKVLTNLNTENQPKYAFVHGVDTVSKKDAGLAVIKYEIPEDTTVQIFVNDNSQPVFEKEHQPGDYFYELSTQNLGDEYEITLKTHNSKVTKIVRG